MALSHAVNEAVRAHRGSAPVPPGGPFETWGQFRHAILNLLEGEFPFEKFVSDNIPFRQIAGMIADFPTHFYAWNRFSRRVFHVTRPLQALLNGTSLQEVSWRDVHWPFEAFMVTLDVPIIGSEGEEYDALLFARLGKNVNPRWKGEDPIQIMMLPKVLDGVTPITLDERKELAELVKKRKVKDIVRAIERIRAAHGMEESKKIWISVIDVPPECLDENVSTSFAQMEARRASSLLDRATRGPVKDKYFAEWDSAARVIVGLSLYLTTSGKSGPEIHRNNLKVQTGRDDPRAIRLEAEVASVYAGESPSEEEVEAFLDHRPRAPGAICATFVMGYWKRPPGQGNDPKAAKTVWVRPHLRRQDRLKPGELPGGLHQDK